MLQRMSALLFVASIATAQGKQTRQVSPAEFAGAALGAAIGFAAVATSYSACDWRDDVVSCWAGARYVPLIGSTLLAPVGAVIAGRSVRKTSSVPRAVTGAVLGAAVVIGVDQVARTDAGGRLGTLGLGIVATLSQGALTAWLAASDIRIGEP